MLKVYLTCRIKSIGSLYKQILFKMIVSKARLLPYLHITQRVEILL